MVWCVCDRGLVCGGCEILRTESWLKQVMLIFRLFVFGCFPNASKLKQVKFMIILMLMLMLMLMLLRKAHYTVDSTPFDGALTRVVIGEIGQQLLRHWSEIAKQFRTRVGLHRRCIPGPVKIQLKARSKNTYFYVFFTDDGSKTTYLDELIKKNCVGSQST